MEGIKKIFILSLVLLSSLIFSKTALAYTYTRTPAGASVSNPVSVSVSGLVGGDFSGGVNYWQIFVDNPTNDFWGQCYATTTSSGTDDYSTITGDGAGSLPTGTLPIRGDYDAVGIEQYPTLTDCQNGTNADATEIFLEGDYNSTIFAVVAPSVTIPDITTEADDQFAAALGFHWSDVVNFTSDNIKLIAGSGIGVFMSLLPWIVALLAISSVIAFIYFGFRFFRH